MTREKAIKNEKCLILQSHSTFISLLSTWTNNIRDSGGSVVGPIFFNNIIGLNRQRWDRSGMRVYNQAFLIKNSEIVFGWYKKLNNILLFLKK
jgi:hypothetical protein